MVCLLYFCCQSIFPIMYWSCHNGFVFSKILKGHCFYSPLTSFLKWWHHSDVWISPPKFSAIVLLTLGKFYIWKAPQLVKFALCVQYIQQFLPSLDPSVIAASVMPKSEFQFYETLLYKVFWMWFLKTSFFWGNWKFDVYIFFFCDTSFHQSVFLAVQTP